MINPVLSREYDYAEDRTTYYDGNESEATGDKKVPSKFVWIRKIDSSTASRTINARRPGEFGIRYYNVRY